MSEILVAKLPSYRQVFGYFMYLHKIRKLAIREASSAIIKAVCEVWDKVSIPTRSNQHSITKLESIFSEWKGLQKHTNRTTQSHKEKENKFVDSLEDLFDMAHANALTKLNPEDQAFLLTERKKVRPGAFGPVDRVYIGKMKWKQKRLHAEVKRQKLCTLKNWKQAAARPH